MVSFTRDISFLSKLFQFSSQAEPPLTPPSPRKNGERETTLRATSFFYQHARCFTPSPRLRGEGGVRGCCGPATIVAQERRPPHMRIALAGQLGRNRGARTCSEDMTMRDPYDVLGVSKGA